MKFHFYSRVRKCNIYELNSLENADYIFEGHTFLFRVYFAGKTGDAL